MAEYSDYNSTEDAVPAKLMVFVGVIGVLALGFFLVAFAIDRKPVNGNIDPTDPRAYEQTDGPVQETPDLWVQPKPPQIDQPPAVAAPIKDPFEKVKERKSPLRDDPTKKQEPASNPS